MCWYVEFKVEMLDKRPGAVEKIEKIINGYTIKPTKKGINEVVFVNGSINDGYRTNLHCDCDNVREKKDDKDKKENKVQLRNYPELFKIIIEQREVKNIQVHWYWSKVEDKNKVKKITISEFIDLNENYDLSSNISYKILREKYF